MSEKNQKLVYAIIEFLNQSIADGTVKADDKESLEVAVQCIGEAFGVDPSDPQQAQKLSIKPLTLQQIFEVYMKTRDKAQQAASGSSSKPASSPENPSAEDKAKAEDMKKSGNSLMSQKKYDEAIDSYSEAIALDATNPVYYSNRAAAHSSKGDHLSAVGDAEKAIACDTNFVKGYHRLGHGHYSLGDYKAAASAFERGLKIEPSNPALKQGLQNSQARIVPDTASDSDSSSARSAPGAGPGGSMADLLGNMGGGGGPGGMPNLASLMNNPQMMAMAQQLAANGGLDSLMGNPAVADMMNRVSQGDMPSMEDIMGDPSLRQLASQFMGGAGRGAGAGAGA